MPQRLGLSALGNLPARARSGSSIPDGPAANKSLFSDLRLTEGALLSVKHIDSGRTLEMIPAHRSW
jgi:hypothetical protein